jgi:hypothetical protein
MNGPNCFNTALLLAGVLDTSRHTQAPEMTFWLQSPLCRELDPNERALPGDVIMIRGRAPDGTLAEVHAANFVSDELIFSKDGVLADNLPKLSASAQVLSGYGVQRKECYRVKGVSSSCTGWANFFRCSSRKELLAAAPLISEKIQKARESAHQWGCNLSAIAYGTAPLSVPALNALESSIEALKADVRTEIKTIEAEPPPLSREEQLNKLLWGGILEEIRSEHGQLSFLRGDVGFRAQDLNQRH